MRRFEGKIAVITGGSRGIGREICLGFAREGAHVAFCYRQRQDKAKEVMTEVEKYDVDALSFKCSVNDYEGISMMMKTIYNRFQSIDILINNAGILKVGAFVGMNYEDWKDMIETNIHGLFVCSKTALPYLLKSKGIIINISSFIAYRPFGFAQAVYAATKAGIIGFSRSLNNEIASMGVRVNVVAPGLVDTEMIKFLGDKIINQMLIKTHSKRLGTPEEIARIVLFLASEEAKLISGQTIVVDGGGVNYQF